MATATSATAATAATTPRRPPRTRRRQRRLGSASRWRSPPPAASRRASGRPADHAGHDRERDERAGADGEQPRAATRAWRRRPPASAGRRLRSTGRCARPARRPPRPRPPRPERRQQQERSRTAGERIGDQPCLGVGADLQDEAVVRRGADRRIDVGRRRPARSRPACRSPARRRPSSAAGHFRPSRRTACRRSGSAPACPRSDRAGWSRPRTSMSMPPPRAAAAVIGSTITGSVRPSIACAARTMAEPPSRPLRMSSRRPVRSIVASCATQLFRSSGSGPPGSAITDLRPIATWRFSTSVAPSPMWWRIAEIPLCGSRISSPTNWPPRNSSGIGPGTVKARWTPSRARQDRRDGEVGGAGRVEAQRGRTGRQRGADDRESSSPSEARQGRGRRLAAEPRDPRQGGRSTPTSCTGSGAVPAVRTTAARRRTAVAIPPGASAPYCCIDATSSGSARLGPVVSRASSGTTNAAWSAAPARSVDR